MNRDKKPRAEPQPEPPTPANCRNCGAPLSGPFCSECGQEVADRPATLSGFLRESFEDVFSLHSRTLTTFYHLLFKPGSLTEAYFSGKKSRYAPPIQVYLVAAAIFFLVNSYHSFIHISDQNKVRSAIGLTRTGQQIPPSKIEALKRQGVSVELFRERFRSTVSQSLPQFMIGSVLLFALVVWLFHPRRPALYHVVFALHWTAVFLLLMSSEQFFLPEGVDSVLVRAPFNVLAFVHLIFSLRRVYSYGWIRAVAGGVLLFLLFNVILVVWVLSVGFYSLASVT